MAKKEMSKNTNENCAVEYLKLLQNCVEEAGGLSALWSERTARMNSIQVTSLGDALGFTNKGEYSPSASISLVRSSIEKLAKEKSNAKLNMQSKDLNEQCDNFEQEIAGVWLNYANEQVDKNGGELVIPSAQQLKESFVAGEYDSVLKDNYSLLKGSETNLLLANYQFKIEASQPDYFAEQ